MTEKNPNNLDMIGFHSSHLKDDPMSVTETQKMVVKKEKFIFTVTLMVSMFQYNSLSLSICQ